MELLCKHIYDNMHVDTKEIYVNMAIRLWKCLNLLTFTLGGDGLMVFMGNEFGHPEWVEFPSERNNQSYWRCRRQWSLINDDKLAYKGLNDFTKGLMHFLKDNPTLTTSIPYILMLHGNKVKVRKGNYIIAAHLATDFFDGSGLGKPLFTTDPDGGWKGRGMWAGIFEPDDSTATEPDQQTIMSRARAASDHVKMLSEFNLERTRSNSIHKAI